MIEFTPWPKIARLNRDIVITEKIDGTNAAVGVLDLNATRTDEAVDDRAIMVPAVHVFEPELSMDVLVYAQSRKNIITPERDNFGFAKWVYDNAEALATTLGPGLHFGEYWGSGIQRGYGLPKGEKRFSLFNTSRWGFFDEFPPEVEGLGVVPVLYEGPFDGRSLAEYETTYPEDLGRPTWIDVLSQLAYDGSRAAPGFMRPEGIVIYHKAANEMFKVTLENDEEPKEVATRRLKAA